MRVALDPDVARVDLRGLEQLDLERLVATLAEAGARFALVFGSRANGTARPGSDLDVGVVLDRPVDAWGIQVPDAVQVVDLERLPLDVAGRAAVEGLVLVEVDPAARARWVAQTRTRFYDEAPRRAWIAREALEAIAGG